MYLINAFRFMWSPVNSETSNWVTRVITNGGAEPSLLTRQAVDQWFTTVKAESGLQSAIKSCCMFVPDSLSAALTPLITAAGSDPWTNTNFVTADLNGDGLIGDASSKYLDPGVNPNLHISSDDSGHLSVYCHTGNDEPKPDWDSSDGGFGQFGMYVSYEGETIFDCYRNGGDGRVSAANSEWEGFLLGSRISSTDIKVYKGNSSVSWVQIASGSGQDGNRPDLNTYLFAQNGMGSPLAPCDKRYSFASIGEGLTSSQGQALFNAVQACRASLGGGYR